MRLGLALAILLGTTPTALAEGFDIVVPDRPDVPIIINGIDVNYAVLEGAYGLGKGVHNQPTIYGGRLAPPEPNVGHYYPTLGLRPATGRLEIEPPAKRKLPQPAESYHQSWHSQSMSVPPTAPNPEADVPLYPPPVILAPPGGDDLRRNDLPGPPRDLGRRPERLPN